MRYILASKRWALDKRTWQFQGYQKASEVGLDRPFYSYEPRTQYPRSEVKTYIVDLNGFNVEYKNVGDWSLGDTKAEIAVGDKLFGIEIQPAMLLKSVEGFYYQITFEGRRIQGTVRFGNNSSRIYFQYIPGLFQQPVVEVKRNKFYYGVSRQQYEICYKDKMLSGKCYALLCGAFAVLLDDDMSFDSLAILKGADVEKLTVERFVYSRNSYVVKMMTLLK